MMRSTHLPAFTLALLLAACAGDPAPKADGAHHDTAAVAARTTPLPGFVSHHREIRTPSPDAQRFFDEGLTLLYGFNHEEAFRSFELAAVHDSLSPMLHWGMALALGTNINDPAPAERLRKAYVYLAAAESRAANGNPVEQGLVAALAARYARDADGDQAAREAAYAAAMGDLSQRFPGDADVAVLHAESLMNLHPWRLYTADGTPEPWTPPIVAALERVLAAVPDHPGANHFYIHAVEASRDPGRATPSARRLETLVPGAGHLVHMPAHIYMRTGEYTRAARANATAAAVDEAYFTSGGTKGFYAMGYYSHNLQFESAAAMFAGNFAEARDAARRTVALAAPMAHEMAMLEMFAAQELVVLVRFGRWADVLAATAPDSALALLSGYHHWARGAALASTGRAAEASRALEALRAARGRLASDAAVGPVNSADAVLAAAIEDLDGRIRLASGDRAGAIAAFTRGVAAEDRLGYNEPPDWLLPERERLGAALLTAGDAAGAARTFREDLATHVGNPWALFGLWKSLEAQRSPEAAAVRAEFERAWAGADVTLGDGVLPTP